MKQVTKLLKKKKKVKLLTKINMASIKKELNMVKSFITQLLPLDVFKKNIYGSNPPLPVIDVMYT